MPLPRAVACYYLVAVHSKYREIAVHDLNEDNGSFQLICEKICVLSRLPRIAVIIAARTGRPFAALRHKIRQRCLVLLAGLKAALFHKLGEHVREIRAFYI